MNHRPHKIVFVYPSRITNGGMPDDIRRFVAAVSEVHHGQVLLLSRGVPADDSGLLKRVQCISLEAPGVAVQTFDSLDKTDVTIFITFSDLTNVRLSRYLLHRGLHYSMLPT